MWTQSEAIELAVSVESIAPKYGAHVALTGGLLYKSGPRKDCDLLLYRIRHSEIDFGLWSALESIGLKVVQSFGFVTKAQFKGKAMDILFPEHSDADSDYP